MNGFHVVDLHICLPRVVSLVSKTQPKAGKGVDSALSSACSWYTVDCTSIRFLNIIECQNHTNKLINDRNMKTFRIEGFEKETILELFS